MHFTEPGPLLLNAWKHHFGFIIEQIGVFQNAYYINLLKDNLKKIGNSTIDLYLGEISISEISKFTISILNEKDLLSESNYKAWINSSADAYREITFPDSSIWIFKSGIDPERYIHIHPGRNVPHSIRVKANNLKTSIATSLLAIVMKENIFELGLINKARKEICDLQPIRFVAINQELGQLLHLFGETLGLTL